MSQIKVSGTGGAKHHDHKPPLKKQRASLPRPLSPKAERKLLPVKSRTQEAGRPEKETIYKGIESKAAFGQVTPLLSVKAELKIIDELKARRVGVLRAIEQQCEDNCREGTKPCSIMLRLEIIHAGAGFAQSWVK